MPEYLVPAFLAALESGPNQWQIRMQAILALQILHHTFSPDQTMILQDSLERILDHDSSDLVKQASKQTLLLWDAWGGDGDDDDDDDDGPGNNAVGRDGGQAEDNCALNSSLQELTSSLESDRLQMQLNQNQTPNTLNSSLSSVGSVPPNTNTNLAGITPPAYRTPDLGGSLSTAANTSFNSSHDSLTGLGGLNSLGSTPSLGPGKAGQVSGQISSQGSDPAGQGEADVSQGLQFMIPEDFLTRLRTQQSTQLLEEIHQCILGATLPLSSFSSTKGDGGLPIDALSLQDMGVLKRIVDLMLQIPNFKISLTSLYIIGDLVSHPTNKMIQENTLRVGQDDSGEHPAGKSLCGNWDK